MGRTKICLLYACMPLFLSGILSAELHAQNSTWKMGGQVYAGFYNYSGNGLYARQQVSFPVFGVVVEKVLSKHFMLQVQPTYALRSKQLETDFVEIYGYPFATFLYDCSLLQKT